MKKLLYISTCSKLGGAEISLLNIIRSIRDYDYSIECIIPESGELEVELSRLNIKLHYLKIPSYTPKTFLGKIIQGIKTIHAGLKLHLLVKKEKINLIHANNWKATLPLCLLPLKLPCPVIVQHRDVIIKHKRLFEKILQKATYHLAASKYIANSLFSEKEKTKYATSYSTIDMTQFTALPSKKEARNKLNLPQDSDIYINIGNFSLWKKQKRFIEVFAEILKQKPHSFAVIAGKAFDSFANSEREKLIQKINTINLADKIIINNYNYQEIPALFAAADIVLHFADNEPMGRIVLEAYASKRNILVPNSGGSCELVKKLYSAPTRNIFSTERYKPEKVASKAIALLKNKPLFENKNITPFLASTQAKELNTLYSNMLNPTKHQYKMDNLHKRR